MEAVDGARISSEGTAACVPSARRHVSLFDKRDFCHVQIHFISTLSAWENTRSSVDFSEGNNSDTFYQPKKSFPEFKQKRTTLNVQISLQMHLAL